MRTKKLFSVLLCIALLLGVAAVAASALDYYVGAGAATAPTIDGVIGDGEYANTTGALDTKADTAGVMYLAHTITTTASGHTSQYYWDYDADYLYLAYSGVAEMNSTVRFYLGPNASEGGRDTIRLSADISWGDLGTVSATTFAADSTPVDAVWEDYVAECASDNWDTGSYNVNVVEVKIKRSALGNADSVGVRGFISPEAEKAGEVYWGGDPATSVMPYQDIWCSSKAGFHVLHLYDPKVIDLSKGGAEVNVDGTIGDGEYQRTISSAITESNNNAWTYITPEKTITAGDFPWDVDSVT